jgi:hypothetical protein
MVTKQIQSGYKIAKNSNLDAFFVSSSSYDRPKWTSLEESTTYPSPEIANNALTRLFKYGAYSARLWEANNMQFSFPNEGPNRNQKPIVQSDELHNDDLHTNDPNEEFDDTEMKAGTLSKDPLDDLNIDDDEIRMDDDNEDDVFDTSEDDEFPSKEENEQSFLSPVKQQLTKGVRPTYKEQQLMKGVHPTHSTENSSKRSNQVREGNFTIPSKSSVDAKSADNKNTVLDAEKPTKIKFTQDNELCYDYASDIHSCDDKIVVPANVKRVLKNIIDKFQDSSDFNNGRDDSEASFSLTVVDALKTIEDCLDLGTPEGLTQAKIKLSSYMGPILTYIPDEVKNFLWKENRASSLKNIFYDKWDSVRDFPN